MKVLLDANVPAPLGKALKRHQVVLAGERNWQSLTNGVLLGVAENGGFDVLVTCDQNIPDQQNLSQRRIALVVISTNHWPTLRPVIEKIVTRIGFAQRGQLMRIDVDEL